LYELYEIVQRVCSLIGAGAELQQEIAQRTFHTIVDRVLRKHKLSSLPFILPEPIKTAYVSITANGLRKDMFRTKRRERNALERYRRWYVSQEKNQRADDYTEAQSDAVRHVVEELPHDYRRVLRMYYLDDLSAPKIARELGVSPEVVRKRLQRARIMARKLLGSILEQLDE
jgi:RNA polymerase sigma factor (sigma-70 family)